MKSLFALALCGLFIHSIFTDFAMAQTCKGWEVDLSEMDIPNPPRTVSVNTRDPRVYCSVEAEQRNECKIAPKGVFHTLALVQCPPGGDAKEFDKAVAHPDKHYNLNLLSICSAVRIARNWALSAAHCVTKEDNSPMFADEVALALDFEAKNVRRLAILPILSIELSGDDLALLKFDPNVAPALDSVPSYVKGITEIYDQPRLDEEKNNFFDSGLIELDTDWPISATILGYGETNAEVAEGSGLLGRLVEAKIKLDSTSMPESEKSRLLRANSSDASAPKLCSGDSGGPWYILDTALIGLSIKSDAVCTGNASNIADAIRVAPFCEWIENTTCSAGNSVCCVRAGFEKIENRKTSNGCNCVSN